MYVCVCVCRYIYYACMLVSCDVYAWVCASVNALVCVPSCVRVCMLKCVYYVCVCVSVRGVGAGGARGASAPPLFLLGVHCTPTFWRKFYY